MWVKPRATSSQLQKNRSDIFRGWDSLNNGYTTLVGVAYLTGYDLRGQGYDALRERFSKYDIEVCSGFSTLFNYLSHLNNRHYQLVDQYFDGEVIVDSASLNAQMDVLMRQLEHYASYRSLFTFDGFANALTFGAHKSNAIEKAIDVLRNKLMKLCQYASATNSYYAKAREMTACLKRGIRLAGNLTYVEGRFVGNSRGYERWLSELHDIMAEIDKKIEDLKKHEKKYKGIVYTDMPGRYGGAQAGPLEIFNSKDRTIVNIRQQIIDKIKALHPNFTDKEVRNFLAELNGEGCGYVALCNTIFEHYAGRETDFKRTFGFSMYRIDSEGNRVLNHELLLVDLYVTEDVSSKNGTTVRDREKLFEHYMNEKGIQVDIVNGSYQTDPQAICRDYERLSARGSTIIRADAGTIMKKIPSGTTQTLSGGHAMTVVDYRDGVFIVSSWGEEYEIDANDLVDPALQVVCW